MSDIIAEAEASIALDGETQTIAEDPKHGGPKFETKKFVMQACLEKASAVLPSRDIQPVLKNFLVEVSAGRINVTATDLDLSVVATTELVTTERAGSAVFPGKRILEIAKEADESALIIDVEPDESGTLAATVRCKDTVWQLKLSDGADYPATPNIEDLEFHPIDRVKFLDALNRVRYAAANDTVRPSLMMIDITDGKVRAADGVRFQQVDVEDWWPNIDVQIPTPAIDNLVKLLRLTEAPKIELADDADHLVFRIASDVYLVSHLTAQFPDVDEILLKPALANDQVLRVDREELKKAIQKVRITADPETSAVTLRLSENQLVVASKDKFGNTAETDLHCAWNSGDREVAFNHVHLTDMLEMADVKSCLFLLGPDTKTRKSPIMLKDEEAGMIGVLNQIRLDFLT